MSYLSYAFPRKTDDAALDDGAAPAVLNAPWYGNIAIASGLLAVPILMALAGWHAMPVNQTDAISGTNQSTLASSKPAAEINSLEHARLRLTPL